MKRIAVRALATVFLPLFISGIVTEVLYPGMFWWLGIVAGVGVLYFCRRYLH